MYELERRAVRSEFEIRATPTGGATIRGHGAVFDSLSQNLGGFVERVDPGAFKKTLADNPDTRALINHDPMYVLGRTRSGTLRMSTDSIGLAYEIDIPETTYARDLLVSMERGDITQSSFAFRVAPGGDAWDTTDEGFPLRILRGLSLANGDVSVVSYPAYEAADSSVAYRSLAESTGLPLEMIRRAATDNNLADLMRNGAPVPETAPEPESAQDEIHAPAWLARARQMYPRQ